MINKARRADNIIEWIIIAIVAIIFLNLFLGKVYDHFQETVASSKLNKMFQPEQTRFEASSGTNYADPSSQINVPLVGEQGLERYRNGSQRVIDNLMSKDLTGNWLWQRNLAEEATVQCFITRYIDGGSCNYAPFVNGTYGIIINSSYGTTLIPAINPTTPINWWDSSFTNLNLPTTTEQEKIDAVAKIKMKFANVN